MESIISYLKGSGRIGDDLQNHDLYSVVPPGWHSLVGQIIHFKEMILSSDRSCKFSSVGIDKGLLRIHGSCSLEIDQSLFNRLTQSIAMDSSVSCMVCGKRGFRRKEEERWPSFCGGHYVEYVNYIDIQE